MIAAIRRLVRTSYGSHELARGASDRVSARSEPPDVTCKPAGPVIYTATSGADVFPAFLKRRGSTKQEDPMTMVVESASFKRDGAWRELTFMYTNYKMETERRHVLPMRVWYGSSAYHQGEQWFLNALDLDKNEYRNFAMRDMKDVATR